MAKYEINEGGVCVNIIEYDGVSPLTLPVGQTMRPLRAGTVMAVESEPKGAKTIAEIVDEAFAKNVKV